MELLLARGTPLRPTAEVVAWDGSLKEIYRGGNAFRSTFWFALLTFGDEVITSESSFQFCWEQVMNVGALVVQVSGGSAPTIVRNILSSVNVRTKAVYLALPSVGGEAWSAMFVAMLANALPRGITLVLDLSQCYCVLPDMFDLRGRTFGPNVIVVPPLSRPRMVVAFKQVGVRASNEIVAALNKFIGRLMATDGAPEDRRRRAAFNLFWTAKTVCKLGRLKWITCSAGPDGTILHFAEGVPVKLIRARLKHHRLHVNVSASGAFNANFMCSRQHELMISVLLGMKDISSVMAARASRLAPPKGRSGPQTNGRRL
ncbi:MAG: hypothetical protein ACTS4T_01405 [Candidatus Hodgkinia cicadicola]